VTNRQASVRPFQAWLGSVADQYDRNSSSMQNISHAAVTFFFGRNPPLDDQKHFLSLGLQNSPARFPLAVCMKLLDGENRLQEEDEKLLASSSHICGSKLKYKNARISPSTLKTLFYCATTSTVVVESPFLGMEGFSSRGDTIGSGVIHSH
jgi:hypothetical protein